MKLTLWNSFVRNILADWKTCVCVRKAIGITLLLGWYEKEIYSEPKAIINSDKNDTSKNQNVNLEIWIVKCIKKRNKKRHHEQLPLKYTKHAYNNFLFYLKWLPYQYSDSLLRCWAYLIKNYTNTYPINYTEKMSFYLSYFILCFTPIVVNLYER